MYLSFAKFGMLNSRNSISCLSCKVDVKLVSHQQGRKQMNWLQSMTKQQSLFSIILVLQNLYQLWPVSKKHRLQLVGRIKSTVHVSYPSLCFIFSPQCLVCVLYPNPCFIPSLQYAVCSSRFTLTVQINRDDVCSVGTCMWDEVLLLSKKAKYSVYEHDFESPWLWGNIFTFKTMNWMTYWYMTCSQTTAFCSYQKSYTSCGDMSARF